MSKKQKFVTMALGVGSTAKGSGVVANIGVLSLTPLKKASKIGSRIKKSNLGTTEVKILFATPESVLDLIKDLVKMLPEMRSYKKELSIATKNIPNRRINQLGPVPRKRKK